MYLLCFLVYVHSPPKEMQRLVQYYIWSSEEDIVHWAVHFRGFTIPFQETGLNMRQFRNSASIVKRVGMTLMCVWDLYIDKLIISHTALLNDVQLYIYCLFVLHGSY